MATRGIAITIQYVAWDTAANAGKTGDATNHTLRWLKDGVSAAPTNSPTEVDAANCPGVYKLALTASETDCNIGTLCGKSSTANVALMPVTIQFERLPDAAPGTSGGVPVIGSAPLTNLDASVSSRAPAATALSTSTWTNARAANLDNLDTTISSRAPAATALSTATWTNARAANLDNLDVAVSTRLAASSYTAPDNTGISAIKAKTDQLTFVAGDVVATLDGEQVIVATNNDKTGYTLTAAYDRAKNALAVSEYTAPDNVGIAAIKAKTDQLSFVAGDVVATLDGEQVVVSTNNDKTGYALTAAYDRAKNALAVSEYVAPDNAGISAIKAKTDRLTFNAENYVYAVATAEVDEQAIIDGILAGLSGGINVIVQPLGVRVFEPVGEGGTITFWQYAHARAAWYVSADLRGHSLVWIAYTQADRQTPVSTCSGSEINIEWQDAQQRSYVSLDAAESKVPAPGVYRYVLRDQTVDAVLFGGVLIVRAAPDAA